MAFQQNTVLSAKELSYNYLTRNKVMNALALQAPVQFLSYSIATYFVGLFIYITYPMQNGFHDSLTKVCIFKGFIFKKRSPLLSSNYMWIDSNNLLEFYFPLSSFLYICLFKIE